MGEGFDWYDPKQTRALIESQQAELVELRAEGVRLRAKYERLRGSRYQYRIALQSITHLAVPRIDTILEIARAALEGE
jgi:cell division protein FtsB